MSEYLYIQSSRANWDYVKTAEFLSELPQQS